MCDVHAAELKEKEIPFKWNELLSLYVYALFVVRTWRMCWKSSLMQISPLPQPKTGTGKSPCQALLNHTHVPKVCMLMKTIAIFTHVGMSHVNFFLGVTGQQMPAAPPQPALRAFGAVCVCTGKVFPFHVQTGAVRGGPCRFVG